MKLTYRPDLANQNRPKMCPDGFCARWLCLRNPRLYVDNIEWSRVWLTQVQIPRMCHAPRATHPGRVILTRILSTSQVEEKGSSGARPVMNSPLVSRLSLFLITTRDIKCLHGCLLQQGLSRVARARQSASRGGRTRSRGLCSGGCGKTSEPVTIMWLSSLAGIARQAGRLRGLLKAVGWTRDRLSRGMASVARA
jgi:hypothetical protein